MESVETDLQSSDGYIKDRQMLFLRAIFTDTSEVTSELLKKLNRESNCKLLQDHLNCVLV